ncbi:MAG: hypothetical protein JSV01_03645 [Desulfobacterales bacterium]|nr:MAG: hypothetical protein JSV01_03645 [Desulfobacterales bacterium]
MRKYHILVPILTALLMTCGAMELRRTADATIRSDIDEPIYTIAPKHYSVEVTNGKRVIKLGPMFWGLYPGAVAFKKQEDALAYMKEKDMNTEELVVYRLSGDYESDVNQEGKLHRINKSLLLIEKLKY